jgi:hypothetical protein
MFVVRASFPAGVHVVRLNPHPIDPPSIANMTKFMNELLVRIPLQRSSPAARLVHQQCVFLTVDVGALAHTRHWSLVVGAYGGSAYVRRRTEPVLIRKYPAKPVAKRTPLVCVVPLAQLLEIRMSLSSWVVLGLIGGFMVRRLVIERGNHQRHSTENRWRDCGGSSGHARLARHVSRLS